MECCLARSGARNLPGIISKQAARIYHCYPREPSVLHDPLRLAETKRRPTFGPPSNRIFKLKCVAAIFVPYCFS
jgi:hypothetical protein